MSFSFFDIVEFASTMIQLVLSVFAKRALYLPTAQDTTKPVLNACGNLAIPQFANVGQTNNLPRLSFFHSELDPPHMGAIS